MSQEVNESTRVMPTGGAPSADRTMVAPQPGFGGATGTAVTQMGATVTCAVCGTVNPGMETYCAECGFLLASAPGTVEAAPVEEGPVWELVENVSGRRFRLRRGVNTIGRENCDILLMDGTVSRRHAQITVEDATIILTDLGSTNGTLVNGNRIAPNQPTPLPPGAALRLGNAQLTLSGGGGPAEATIVAPPAEPSEPAAEQTLLAPPPVKPASPPEAALSTLAPEPAALSAEEAPIARLRATGGEAQDILISYGTITIGRRTGNSVVLSGDPYVSGRHAEILCDNTGCYLTDAGSTNGTLVNGTRLEPGHKQLLLDGDEISIGQGTYIFETLPPPEEEETAPPKYEEDMGAPQADPENEPA